MLVSATLNCCTSTVRKIWRSHLIVNWECTQKPCGSYRFLPWCLEQTSGFSKVQQGFSKVQLLWWFYCVASKRLALWAPTSLFRLWFLQCTSAWDLSAKSIFTRSVNNYIHRLVSFQWRFSCNVIPIENTKENRKPSPCKCTRGYYCRTENFCSRKYLQMHHCNISAK